MGSPRFQQTLLTSLTMLYLSLSKLYSCKSLWHFIIMDDNGDDDDIGGGAMLVDLFICWGKG